MGIGILSKVKEKIKVRNENKQERREALNLLMLKGKSSKYFTYKTLKEMCDKHYREIWDYYNNNTINVVNIKYIGNGVAKLWVYFDDNGMYNRLSDIDKKNPKREYSRANKIIITTDELNKHQGFDNLIKMYHTKYRENEKRKDELLRLYREEGKRKLKQYL